MKITYTLTNPISADIEQLKSIIDNTQGRYKNICGYIIFADNDILFIYESGQYWSKISYPENKSIALTIDKINEFWDNPIIRKY